jgi:hypothetical protein
LAYSLFFQNFENPKAITLNRIMKQDFSKKTNEELLKNIKIARFLTGLLAGALVMLLVLNTMDKEKTIWQIIMMPLCLSPILILNISNIIAMKKEMKSRGL